MANVWKIGSRWSDYGAWNKSIISIFRRSEVVFIGSKDANRFNNEVKIGDYFAIADGYSVKAVAKAVSAPMPLNDMIQKNMIRVRGDEEFEKFDISDDFSWCYGVKVKIVDLPDDLQFNYNKPGAFYRANNAIAKEVIRLYEENLSDQFDIKARTYRIMCTDEKQSDDKLSIINNHTFYTIPIYQREYSWGYEEVSRLISDIFKGFWGVDDEQKTKPEPLFIGTMQLSYKKYISNNEYEQDVIDGQQRLSTILCIIKYLKLKYPQNELTRDLSIDWLETRVNNGIEEKYLTEMLSLKSLDNIQNRQDYSINKYLQNLAIVKDCFENNTCDEYGNELSSFDITAFVRYFQNSIYFVVIETVAGLSKTIQIFNSINTAGLDLNGNDLFKVRFYEYLHDMRNQGEEAFNEIGEIYKKIKDKNDAYFKSTGHNAIDIGNVLSIYQNYLISKYDLPTSQYSKATDTFFEGLFDVLLHVQNHKDLNSLKNKNIELSIQDLNRIIEVAYLWNTSDYRNSKDFISYKLIEWSRYSRYNDVVYQILINNEDLTKEERFEQVYEVLYSLSKMFFCYSIYYAKAVNQVHSFMYGIYRDISNFEHNKEMILSKIREKTQEYKFRSICGQ